MLEKFNRTVLDDNQFVGRFENEAFENHVFKRAVALNITFDGVSFKATVFDTCYFKSCKFSGCSFVGCRFLSSNMHGSTFVDCRFDYSSFDKTNIGSEIFDTSSPRQPNLLRGFARSLRVNFQQMGDAAAVNKAILVELAANRAYLYSGWASQEAYYRRKYHGYERFVMFLRWLGFTALDLIWGNGESATKLIRLFAFLFVIIASVDVYFFRDHYAVRSYADALLQSPEIFFGVLTPVGYWKGYLTILYILRLVIFAFLTSIILKRSSRR